MRSLANLRLVWQEHRHKVRIEHRSETIVALAGVDPRYSTYESRQRLLQR